MGRKVPFVGEEHISRAGQEAEAKKARGRIIDDVISTQKQPTTWEDEVRIDEPQPRPVPKAMRPHMPQAKSVRPNAPQFKKAIIEATMRASLDWIPINNGHGLRINISGVLDQNARIEWRKLLEETDSNGVNQFEFNLTQSPSISLTGLGMLLLFREKKGDRSDIKLCHCNQDVWDVLHWTGMEKYFTIQGGPE